MIVQDLTNFLKTAREDGRLILSINTYPEEPNLNNIPLAFDLLEALKMDSVSNVEWGFKLEQTTKYSAVLKFVCRIKEKPTEVG